MFRASLHTLRTWAKRLIRDVATLWFALKMPSTPWWVKGLCGVIVAYALSPIDLIPDFIPILGLLDDLILLPGLIWLALRSLPTEVLQQSRQQAQAWQADGARLPKNRYGALLMGGLWALLAYCAWRWWY